MKIINKCAYKTRRFNVLPALVVTPGVFATVDIEAGGAAIGAIPLGVVVRQRVVTLAIKLWWWHAGVAIAYGAVTQCSVFSAGALAKWRGGV